MSENKADYYAKHLGQNIILGPNEQMEMIQPVSLPTLLARMVGEYTKELCLHISSDISDGMALAFNRTLLESAQPALAEYLHTITTPPKFVMKQQLEDYIKAEQAIEMSRAGYSDLARKHLGLE